MTNSCEFNIHVNSKVSKHFGNFENLSVRRAEVMMHDCINGMEEPLYGFVTQVFLVENESCQLNVSCNSNGDLIQNNVENNNLPTDRIYQYHTQSPTWRQQYYQSNYSHISRQTGEEFEASGPPRCRVRRDPSNRCMN